MTTLAHPIAESGPVAPPAWKAQVFDGAAGFEALRPDWLKLFGAVTEAAWSCHPDVFNAWRRTLRPDGALSILTVRDDAGRLRGLMPLMRDLAWRGPSAVPRFDYDPRDRDMLAHRRLRPVPVRQIAPMGSLPATMLWVGPMCLAGDLDAVCRAMAGAILGLRGWDLAVLPAVEGREDAAWARAFAAYGVSVRIQTLGRVVQDLRGLAPFDEIVARQKKKFRQNIRRARAAAGEAGLRFQMFEGRSAVMSQFSTLASLANSSWKHQGRDGTEVHIPYEGRQQRFFEAVLSDERLTAQPVLGLASDPEGAVAVFLMLRHGAVVTALLTFWNGRLPAASPGLLLLGATVDWAAASGAKHYYFNATAPWVRYIADATRSVNQVVVFSPSLRGRALAGLADLRQRWR